MGKPYFPTASRLIWYLNRGNGDCAMETGELGNRPKVTIFGEVVDVSPETEMAPFLKDRLQSGGYSSFTLYIDGDEVTRTEEIPDTFEGLDTVEVVKYAAAGRK